MAKYSLDPENKEAYGRKAAEWEKRQSINALSVDQEGASIRYVSPDAYVFNDKLRRNAISELTDTEKKWMENLNSALESLPTYEGNLNRSVTFLFEEDLLKGQNTFQDNTCRQLKAGCIMMMHRYRFTSKMQKRAEIWVN